MSGNIDNMRSSTLRVILLISSILVAVLIAIQLFWLNKVYSLEQKNFNTNVSKAIKGLYEDIGLNDDPGFITTATVEHPNANTFIVPLDTLGNIDSVQAYLVNELHDFDVYADYDISFFSSDRQQYVSYSYHATPTGKQQRDASVILPAIKKDYDFLLLQFPHRYQYVLREIIWWIIGTVFLLVVLVSFGFIMYFFYRQKFLNELQKDFVNNLTHEFKTPLAVMKIASDVLIQPGILQQPERLTKYNQVIREQVTSLQNKTERLLQTVKADSTRLAMEKEPVNINEVVNEAIADIDPLLTEKKATINFIAGEGNMVINGDKEHLVMLMVNLVENALKYSKQPYISIETKNTDGNCTILVKDNGVGIDKKYQNRIFKKFFRVPTGDVHNVKGFGLGLNYVKRIVDEHYGKIEVNSIVGIGTEFVIILPH